MKRLGLVIGGVALLAVGTLGGIVAMRASAAGNVVERHARELRGDIADLRASDASRPVLFEPAEDANAWHLYCSALDVLNAMPQAERDLVPALGNLDKPADPVKMDELLAKYAPQIDELRRALARRRVDPDYEYERGAAVLLPYVHKSMMAVKFLAQAAQHRHDQGREREAIELAVIALGTSQDNARRGFLVNELVRVVSDGVVCERLRAMLKSNALTAADAAWFADALEKLESSRVEFAESLRVDMIGMRVEIVNYARAGLLDRNPALGIGLPGPRQFFSRRVAAAEALEAMDSILREMQATERSPLPERIARCDAALARATAGDNPVIATVLPALGRAWQNHAQCDRDLSLLRAAVALVRHRAEHGAYPATVDGLPGAGAVERYSCTDEEATVEATVAGGKRLTWTVKRK
jgi:hypothetical protein